MHPTITRSTRTSPTLALAVRSQMAAARLGEGVGSATQRRLDALRDDGERGAQAVEYAMVGGVGVTIAALVISLLRGGLVQRIVQAIVDAVVNLITAWFVAGG